MKTKVILVLIFFVALNVFCVVRDNVVRNIVAAAAGDVVGAPVHIGGLSLSIVRQSIKIADFKMFSPKDFPPEVMVTIPRMYVKCDVFSFLKGKLHLRNISFDLREVVLAKNKAGKLNVNTLKIFESKKPVKLIPIQLDSAQVSIGRIVNKDYSLSGPEDIKVHDVSIKRAYRNINSYEQIAALIIAEPLEAAGMRKLSEYGVSMLTGVAALPVSVAFTLAAKDYSRAAYNAGWSKVFATSLAVLKECGQVKSADKEFGIINADVRGSQITLRMRKLSWFKTQITVSARKFMLPHPEVAGGVVYRVTERLR